MDNSGNPLPPGSVDPHYSLDSYDLNGNPMAFGPSAYVSQNNPSSPPFNWSNNTSTGVWISAQSDQLGFNIPGFYVYTTTFDLTGYNPSTASLTGQISADNQITDIILNGISVGTTAIPSGGGGGFLLPMGSDRIAFNSMHNFSINSGFVSGVNTLQIVVINWFDPIYNVAGPTGLIITNLVGSASTLPNVTGLLSCQTQIADPGQPVTINWTVQYN
jgi:hypothetical protein